MKQERMAYLQKKYENKSMKEPETRTGIKMKGPGAEEIFPVESLRM